MSESVYIEKLVKKKRTGRDILILIAALFAAVIISVASLYIPYVRAVWWLVVIIVIYVLIKLVKILNVEYEYCITAGILDIDVLRAQQFRKRVFSVSCRDVEIMAKYSNKAKYDESCHGIAKRIEAVTSIEEEDVFFLVANYEGMRTMLFFQPDDRMLEMFKKYMARTLFI